MSRVDEAFRRAFSQAGFDTGRPVAPGLERLDSYPTERMPERSDPPPRPLAPTQAASDPAATLLLETRLDASVCQAEQVPERPDPSLAPRPPVGGVRSATATFVLEARIDASLRQAEHVPERNDPSPTLVSQVTSSHGSAATLVVETRLDSSDGRAESVRQRSDGPTAATLTLETRPDASRPHAEQTRERHDPPPNQIAAVATVRAPAAANIVLETRLDTSQPLVEQVRERHEAPHIPLAAVASVRVPTAASSRLETRPDVSLSRSEEVPARGELPLTPPPAAMGGRVAAAPTTLLETRPAATLPEQAPERSDPSRTLPRGAVESARPTAAAMLLETRPEPSPRRAEQVRERIDASLTPLAAVPSVRTPTLVLETRPDVSSGQVAQQPARFRRRALLSAEHAGALLPSMDGKLIETAAASRALIGQCRRLAGALREMQASRGVKIVMVSSALPGEGRTLTVTNLALTLASQKQRVLLIDADLRRPSLHKIFGFSNTGGLREGLGPEQVQIPAVAVSPGLTVVSGGRAEADPSAILVSNSMKNLLQEAASTFDWVLLDTPPVSLLDDTHLLSWLTDGVLLVVQAGVTSRKTVASAVEEIGSERVIGTVLNRAGQAGRFGLKGFR